jgi:hypothetical protein
VNKNPFKKLLRSIALPGFGQYLNGKYVKGTVLLILEFLGHVQANFYPRLNVFINSYSPYKECFNLER